jgi:hypothetical protein
MGKDPAALLYIDKWIVATTEMHADARGYYMDLILHQYDKGDLPQDIEELANICRVRFSEFDNFKQVFEHVLKHKFEVNGKNRLENAFAREIIQCRKKFLDKRSHAGKMSYLVKFALKEFKLNKKQLEFIKDTIDLDSVDLKNEQVFKQVLEQTLELYINTNKDINTSTNKEEDFRIKVNSYVEFSETMRSNFIEYWTEKNENSNKMKFEKQETFDVLKRLRRWKKNDFGNNSKTGRRLNEYEIGAANKYDGI